MKRYHWAARGDVIVPVGNGRHFAECIREQRAPLSDGCLGLRVVRLLEAATRSIRAVRAGRDD